MNRDVFVSFLKASVCVCLAVMILGLISSAGLMPCFVVAATIGLAHDPEVLGVCRLTCN